MAVTWLLILLLLIDVGHKLQMSGPILVATLTSYIDLWIHAVSTATFRRWSSEVWRSYVAFEVYGATWMDQKSKEEYSWNSASKRGTCVLMCMKIDQFLCPVKKERLHTAWWRWWTQLAGYRCRWVCELSSLGERWRIVLSIALRKII